MFKYRYITHIKSYVRIVLIILLRIDNELVKTEKNIGQTRK